VKHCAYCIDSFISVRTKRILWWGPEERGTRGVKKDVLKDEPNSNDIIINNKNVHKKRRGGGVELNTWKFTRRAAGVQ
jgi:hypothetical protein